MRHGTTAYYEVAAQIIPVIVLAILVEYRIFGTGRERGDWWASGRALEPDRHVSIGECLFVLLFVALFVLGEFSALEAVRSGKASAWDEFIVATAEMIGFVILLFVPSQPYFESLLDRTPARRLKLRLWHRADRVSARPDDDTDVSDDSE